MKTTTSSIIKTFVKITDEILMPWKKKKKYVTPQLFSRKNRKLSCYQRIDINLYQCITISIIIVMLPWEYAHYLTIDNESIRFIKTEMNQDLCSVIITMTPAKSSAVVGLVDTAKNREIRSLALHCVKQHKIREKI